MHAQVLRPRGVRQRLAITLLTMWPSASGDSVGTPNKVISRLNSPACTYPCQRFAARPHGRRRMTRGHRGSLLLRCRALSSPSPCRFHPGAPPVPVDHLLTVPRPLRRRVLRRLRSRLSSRFHGLRPEFPGSALPAPRPTAGALTTRQASLDAADRSVASPNRAFDAGLRRRRFPPTPPACYRASWQLPGPDSHRQATTSLRCQINSKASPPSSGRTNDQG